MGRARRDLFRWIRVLPSLSRPCGPPRISPQQRFAFARRGNGTHALEGPAQPLRRRVEARHRAPVSALPRDALPARGRPGGLVPQAHIPRRAAPGHPARAGTIQPKNGSWGGDQPPPRGAEGSARAGGRVPSRGGKDAPPPCAGCREWQRHPAAGPCWASGWKPLPLSLGRWIRATAGKPRTTPMTRMGPSREVSSMANAPRAHDVLE